ncbi:MAG: acyltransferase [Defluviimonas sp.]|nr:acyltransferase [Defluviimonas sp.]
MTQHPSAVPAGTPRALPGLVPLTAETSAAISVARTLCITFMIAVHFWPGDVRIMAAEKPLWLEGFYWLLLDQLGRASVPLLSVVSGVLLTCSYARRPRPRAIITGKLRSLIVPMAGWSAALLAFLALRSFAAGQPVELPQTAMGWINALFGVTKPPANFPLTFLRDMFVTCLIALAFLKLYERTRPVAILALMLIWLVEVQTTGFMLFRPQILSFFALGMGLALAGHANYRPGWGAVAGILAIYAVLSVLPEDPVPGMQMDTSLLSHVPRAAMSLLMWKCALEITRARGWLFRATHQLAPHIFVVYCSHALTIAAVAVLGAFGISERSPIYPLVFLLQYPLCLGVGVALSRALSWAVSMPLRRRMRSEAS